MATHPKSKRNTGMNLSQQEFLISASLARGPKHGYALAKNISRETNGQVQFSAGTLYGNLSRMVDSGLVQLEREQEASGRLQKVYGLTDAGHITYTKQARILRTFLSKDEEKK